MSCDKLPGLRHKGNILLSEFKILRVFPLRENFEQPEKSDLAGVTCESNIVWL